MRTLFKVFCRWIALIFATIVCVAVLLIIDCQRVTLGCMRLTIHNAEFGRAIDNGFPLTDYYLGRLADRARTTSKLVVLRLLPRHVQTQAFRLFLKFSPTSRQSLLASLAPLRGPNNSTLVGLDLGSTIILNEKWSEEDVGLIKELSNHINNGRLGMNQKPNK